MIKLRSGEGTASKLNETKLSYLSKLALLDGARVERDASITALGYVTHRINTKPFLAFAGNQKFLDVAGRNPLVSAVVTTADLAPHANPRLGVVTSSDPVKTFYKLHHRLIHETDLYWSDFESQIHSSAHVHPSAIIAPRNVSIGANTVIEAGAIVHERSLIGNDVMIRSRCVISSEGFEYKRFDDRFHLVEHASGIELHDRVQLHTGCIVDRGLFGDNTIVGEGSCLDNMIHVAHGVRIGKNCIVAANAVFSAAVIMEDEARIDPNACVAHELVIGKGAYVTMGAVVTRDVPPGQKVSGNFAYAHDRFLQNLKAAARG